MALLVPPGRSTEFVFNDSSSIAGLHEQVGRPLLLVVIKPSVSKVVTVDEVRVDAEDFIKAIRSHVAVTSPSCDTRVTIMGLDGGDDYRIHLEDDEMLITDCASGVANETVS